MKIQKKKNWGGRGSGRGGGWRGGGEVGLGGQGGCERRIEVFEKIHKKKNRGGGGGPGVVFGLGVFGFGERGSGWM